jgi:transposase
MSAAVSLNGLYQFPSWIIDNIELNFELSIGKVFLRPDARKSVHKCPYCNHPMGEMRTIERQVLDLPLGTIKEMTIQFTTTQGKCSRCENFHTFLPEGIRSNGRATERLKVYVSRLCRFMPVNKAASFFPISVNTARRWDKDVLQRTLPSPDLDNLHTILVDETSIGKGHNYLTVVLNGINGEVLHIAEGKRKTSLESFFKSSHQSKRLAYKPLALIEAVLIERL